MAEQGNFDWSAASEDIYADLPKRNVLFFVNCTPCNNQVEIRSYEVKLCTYDNGVVTYQFTCPSCLVCNVVLADDHVQETLKNLEDIAEIAVSMSGEMYDGARAVADPITEDEFFQFCRNVSNCVGLVAFALGN